MNVLCSDLLLFDVAEIRDGPLFRYLLRTDTAAASRL